MPVVPELVAEPTSRVEELHGGPVSRDRLAGHVSRSHARFYDVFHDGERVWPRHGVVL